MIHFSHFFFHFSLLHFLPRLFHSAHKNISNFFLIWNKKFWKKNPSEKWENVENRRDCDGEWNFPACGMSWEIFFVWKFSTVKDWGKMCRVVQFFICFFPFLPTEHLQLLQEWERFVRRLDEDVLIILIFSLAGSQDSFRWWFYWLGVLWKVY